MVAVIDTVEGMIDDSLWYHYDLTNDALYLQLISTRGQETFGEETDEGFILFRTENDQIAGLTITGYWKQFGTGKIQDSTLLGLQHQVEQAAQRLPAAA